MVKQNLRLQNLEEIRSYVSTTLCQINLLKPDQYKLSERIFARGGKPCGVHFSLQGPRQVNLTAIWETDNNTILFYGCSGQREGRTQLIDAPELDISEAA